MQRLVQRSLAWLVGSFIWLEMLGNISKLMVLGKACDSV